VVLEVLVESGVIGFTCFVWLLGMTVYQGGRALNRLRKLQANQGYWLLAALATMAGMLAHGLVDTVWYRPQVSTLFWLMLALVAGFYQPPTIASAATPDRPNLASEES
jgi:putative inorganic carbon (HCO3(-)) transporter